jgi:dimethylhistidine N-methyltransferase
VPNDGSITRLRRQDVVAAALAGLLNPQKTLPPKLFYDEEGSRLFRRITELPEYYLTRTELGLLDTLTPEVTAAMPAGAVLVEYGASDESKAEFLLRARDGSGAPVCAAYVPIDVAVGGLERTRARLTKSHPHLRVHILPTDFMDPVRLPREFADMPRLGFLPGSTIGNFEPAEAQRFLAQVRETLGPGARLLIGVDLRKDPAVLIPAYNDKAGVTAAFNLNLLVRLNREADADFDLDAFSHRAIWNPTDSRIEMHLISRRQQVVRVARKIIRFAANETIHTENSYKYTLEDFVALVNLAAWRARKVWTDNGGLFSVHLLETE